MHRFFNNQMFFVICLSILFATLLTYCSGPPPSYAQENNCSLDYHVSIADEISFRAQEASEEDLLKGIYHLGFARSLTHYEEYWEELAEKKNFLSDEHYVRFGSFSLESFQRWLDTLLHLYVDDAIEYCNNPN